MKAPYIKPEVLEWLESEFPARIPEEPQPKERYDVLVGHQQVLLRIRREIRRQSSDISQF